MTMTSDKSPWGQRLSESDYFYLVTPSLSIHYMFSSGVAGGQNHIKLVPQAAQRKTSHVLLSRGWLRLAAIPDPK